MTFSLRTAVCSGALAIVALATMTGCDEQGRSRGEDGMDHTKIRLYAFDDFDCTSNWANRNGGLGLVAGTGKGRCTARFPGESGMHRVILRAQIEFDGAPKYRILVDGSRIASGQYPISTGDLVCDCPNWRTNCPDRIVPIDVGVHYIENGSTIEFVGKEVYPCGAGTHGAYAKWRALVFIPQ